MKQLVCGLLFIAGLTSLSFGQVGAIHATGVDNSVPADVPTRGSDAVLFDNLASVAVGAETITSQNFINAAGFYTMGADDFTVTGGGWRINTVTVYGNYDPLGAPAVVSAKIVFYENNGGLPGTVLETFDNLTVDDLDSGDFQVVLTGGYALPPGTYWMGFSVNYSSADGQWFWTTAPNAAPSAHPSAWVQENLNFFGGNCKGAGAWGARIATCAAGTTDADFSMRLDGDQLTAGVTIDPTSVTTTEDGSTVQYGVVLDAPPAFGETVTVTPASDDTGEGDVSAAMNFTELTWETEQFVTVTPGGSGDGNDGDVAYTITNSVTNAGGTNYDGVTAASVAGTNNNIDGINTVTVDPTTISVLEADGTGTSVAFTPTSAPTADVTIALTVPAGLTGPASVTLPSGATAAVNADFTYTQDDIDDDGVSFTVVTGDTVSAHAEFNGIVLSDITVNITNIDVAGITVAGTGNTDETGTTDTFTVVLDSEPTADVTIDIESSDTSEGTVSPASLTFTSANWDTAQTVTVTGVDDNIDDDTVSYSLRVLPASSADANYDGLDGDDVTGNNADDTDTAGVSTSVSSITVSETTGGTFTVDLDTEPMFPVTIAVSSSDTGVATVSPASLTFTGTTTSQTVTVTPVANDTRAEGDTSFFVNFANATSDDTHYDDKPLASVSGTRTDDDGPVGITVAPTSVTTTEGGADQTFTAVLDTEPIGGDVTVAVSSSDTNEATATPSSLTFTTANWSTPQTVTVSPVDDFVHEADGSFNVDLSASGANYGGVTAQVTGTNQDDDDCGNVTSVVVLGEAIVVCGTPGCSVDIEADGTTVATITFPDNGAAVSCVTSSVIAAANTTYSFTSGGVSVGGSVTTVPTLGEWALIAFLALLMVAGIAVMRRNRLA